MLSPDSLLEQLHRNESSFYTVLLNAKSNPTIENFVTVLGLLREYFDSSAKYSLEYEQHVFQSSNAYLAWILNSAFNIGLTPELATQLIAYLQADQLKTDNEVLGDLLEAMVAHCLKLDESTAAEAIKTQILASDNFAGNALRFFKPNDQEFLIATKGPLHQSYNITSGEFKYDPEYHPGNEEVIYVALAQIAKDMKEILVVDKRGVVNNKNVSTSYLIHDITLAIETETTLEGGHLSIEENKRRALEAIYTATIDHKPAFLICADDKHWTALGLMMEGDELYVFKFDSLGGPSIVDNLAIELKDLVKKATGLGSQLIDLSINVQDSANCGIAVAGFIAELSKAIRSGKTVAQIKEGFAEAYTKDIIDKDDRYRTTETFISSVFKHIYKPEVPVKSQIMGSDTKAFPTSDGNVLPTEEEHVTRLETAVSPELPTIIPVVTPNTSTADAVQNGDTSDEPSLDLRRLLATAITGLTVYLLSSKGRAYFECSSALGTLGVAIDIGLSILSAGIAYSCITSTSDKSPQLS